jgi:hypothetical protein
LLGVKCAPSRTFGNSQYCTPVRGPGILGAGSGLGCRDDKPTNIVHFECAHARQVRNFEISGRDLRACRTDRPANRPRSLRSFAHAGRPRPGDPNVRCDRPAARRAGSCSRGAAFGRRRAASAERSATRPSSTPTRPDGPFRADGFSRLRPLVGPVKRGEGAVPAVSVMRRAGDLVKGTLFTLPNVQR